MKTQVLLISNGKKTRLDFDNKQDAQDYCTRANNRHTFTLIKDQMRRVFLVLAAIVLIGCQSLPPAYDVHVTVLDARRISGDTWEVRVQQPGSILIHKLIIDRKQGFDLGPAVLSSHDFAQ